MKPGLHGFFGFVRYCRLVHAAPVLLEFHLDFG